MKTCKCGNNSEEMALQTAITIEDVAAEKRVPSKKRKPTKTTLLQLLLGLMGFFAVALICYKLCSENSDARNESLHSTGTKKGSIATPSSWVTVSTRTTPLPKKREPEREPKNMDKDPIYCRLMASKNQKQTSNARVVWTDNHNSFCSHDIDLSHDGQNVTVDKQGIYEVSVTTCILCDENAFVQERSEMTLLRNSIPVPGCSFVKDVSGSFQGTCSLIRLYENDILSVRINAKHWSPESTSLDIYLRTRKLY